jgi:hypothetical protein
MDYELNPKLWKRYNATTSIMDLNELRLWNLFKLNHEMTMTSMNFAIKSIWIKIRNVYEITMYFGMNPCEVRYKNDYKLDYKNDYKLDV